MREGLQIRLLGAPQISVDRNLVSGVTSAKAKGLLFYLAVTGRAHTRSVLAALLWGDLPDGAARGNLRKAIQLLNKHLGDFLVIERETLALAQGAPSWVDVTEFDALRQGNPISDNPEHLRRAIELYQGDFLEGFYVRRAPNFEYWWLAERARLREGMLKCLVALADHCAEQEDLEGAINLSRRYLVLEPWREEGHRRLMTWLAYSGQRSAALAQYEVCRKILADEFEIQPASETISLYERIQRGELGEAKPVTTPETRLSIFRPATPAFLEEDSKPLNRSEEPFVGRERELNQLKGMLAEAIEGRGKMAFVTGEAGQGKTSLMNEFARRALEEYKELILVNGTCNVYSSLGDPFLPFREALRMLTGDVEEQWAAGAISRSYALRLWRFLPLSVMALADHGTGLIDTFIPGRQLENRAAARARGDEDWLLRLRDIRNRKEIHTERLGLSQDRTFEEYTEVLKALASRQPILMLLDDIHWADLSSISLIAHLAHRIGQTRIFIVGAYRPEDITGSQDGKRHPLETMLNEFRRRFGNIWVDLAQIDENEARALVDGIIDILPNRLGKGFRNALLRRTMGHPLFTVEMIRSMQERGDLVQNLRGQWVEGSLLNWESLPFKVEALIAERVSRLDERLRKVLAVASVEGERFTIQVVSRLVGLEERDLIELLSKALVGRHRLIRDRGERRMGDIRLARYQFSHALFQVYLYHILSIGERRLLHGAVASALEDLHKGHTADIAGELAHHFTKAGRAEKAIEYLLLAGENAHLAFANEDAIRYFQRALDLLKETEWGETRMDWMLEALGGLGQAFCIIGETDEGEAALHEAIALGKTLSMPARKAARLYHWLAEVLFWQNRPDEVIPIAEEGLALLGEDSESPEAAALLGNLAGALITGKIVDFERNQQIISQLAGFIHRLPYTRDLRPLFPTVINGLCADKKLAQSVSLLRHYERLGRETHDLEAVAHAILLTANQQYFRGDYSQALATAREAHRLAIQTNSNAVLNYALLTINTCLVGLGQFDQSPLVAHKRIGSPGLDAIYNLLIATWPLCLANDAQAVPIVQRITSESHSLGPYLQPGVIAWLGWAFLAMGKFRPALAQFERSLSVRKSGQVQLMLGPSARLGLASVLGGMEMAYQDGAAFRSFCQKYRDDNPEMSAGPLVQWYLEPAHPRIISKSLESTVSLADTSLADWTWKNPFDDCIYELNHGLSMQAAPGRDLWFLNLSAPRWMREIAGDFAAQTVCLQPDESRPAIGGLLIWQDRANYLRLDWGSGGRNEITFMGCLGNEDKEFGRGRLEAERVWLRLERAGPRVNVYCSADGERWFTAGFTDFSVANPIQVGLFAIGNIDPIIHPGAYPDGSEIRFADFWLWRI